MNDTCVLDLPSYFESSPPDSEFDFELHADEHVDDDIYVDSLAEHKSTPQYFDSKEV